MLLMSQRKAAIEMIDTPQLTKQNDMENISSSHAKECSDPESALSTMR